MFLGLDPSLIENLLRALVEEIRPEDALEALIVQRVAAGHWRLRRAYRLEIRTMENFHNAPQDPPAGDAAATPSPRRCGLGFSDEIDRLVRYESLIDRELAHAMSQLDRMLTHRAGRSQEGSRFNPALLPMWHRLLLVLGRHGGRPLQAFRTHS